MTCLIAPYTRELELITLFTALYIRWPILKEGEK